MVKGGRQNLNCQRRKHTLELATHLLPPDFQQSLGVSQRIPVWCNPRRGQHHMRQYVKLLTRQFKSRHNVQINDVKLLTIYINPCKMQESWRRPYATHTD